MAEPPEAPNDPKLTALIASVRRRCKPGLWSQGVTLARAGAVTIESRSAEEIVLRVRSPGRIVAPTVVLYPTENETECDCPARVSPCEHVAAAVIALSAPAGGGAAATEAALPSRPRRRSRSSSGRRRRGSGIGSSGRTAGCGLDAGAGGGGRGGDGAGDGADGAAGGSGAGGAAAGRGGGPAGGSAAGGGRGGGDGGRWCRRSWTRSSGSWPGRRACGWTGWRSRSRRRSCGRATLSDRAPGLSPSPACGRGSG